MDATAQLLYFHVPLTVVVFCALKIHYMSYILVLFSDKYTKHNSLQSGVWGEALCMEITLKEFLNCEENTGTLMVRQFSLLMRCLIDHM